MPLPESAVPLCGMFVAWCKQYSIPPRVPRAMPHPLVITPPFASLLLPHASSPHHTRTHIQHHHHHAVAMCRRSSSLHARLFILLVVFLFLLCLALTLLCLKHDPAIPHFSSDPRSSFITVYLSIVILALISYFRTHLTHPGGLRHWSHHRPDLTRPISSSSLPYTSDKPRFCSRCNAPKPRRVHHCSECQQCILRFDHHCPWIGACIGLFNAKFFLLFLLYTSLSCLLTLAYQILFLLHCRAIPLPPEHVLLLALGSPLVLIVSSTAFVATFSLFLCNLKLACINQTSLERFKIDNGHSVPNYDAGLVNNLTHLLGTNRYAWLLPVAQTFNTPQSAHSPKI